MFLHAVTIENFRGLKSARIELAPVTVLVGENNSGKSSVLDALRLAFSRATPRRGELFADDDAHLAAADATPSSAPEIAITLEFRERSAHEWPDELIQILGDAIVSDTSGLYRITARVTGRYDTTDGAFATDWAFLDDAGNALTGRAAQPGTFSKLLQLAPFFLLPAQRDAARDFSPRGQFWGSFLRDPGIPEVIRTEVEETLAGLNTSLLGAHAPLKSVQEHLAKVPGAITTGTGDRVAIEPLPGRVIDLLARTQVTVTTPSGARLPLARHGAGTQSLSVLFLFESYARAILSSKHGTHASPILGVEEPEAHLHPNAVRGLWQTLVGLRGQTIVTTHSGDLLARVPLAAIRRFHRVGGDIRVGRVEAGSLTAEEERKVDYHIRASRGDLLFARVWLLVEGESDYWVYTEAAALLGVDLDRLGARVVPYQHAGVEPLLKIARDLGILWFLAPDGDAAGKKALAIGRLYLQGDAETSRLALLPRENVELLLCAAGFGAVYEAHVSPQKAAKITVGAADPKYWEQVLAAQDANPKPLKVLEVMAAIRTSGTMPAELQRVVTAVQALCRR